MEEGTKRSKHKAQIPKQVLEAKFVMVALDPDNTDRAVPNHPLECASDEERQLFALGESEHHDNDEMI